MGGGWVESRIRLISAETEAEALLGLAELGKNVVVSISNIKLYLLVVVQRDRYLVSLSLLTKTLIDFESVNNF